MTFRLLAPGTRKRNPFWLVRGSVDGREYEISSKSANKADARVLAKQFEANLARELAQEKAAAALRATGGCFVYFIASADGRVKIGSSTLPERRLAALQTGSSVALRLLGAAPGNYEDEKNLQIRFARYRLHGEWFDLAGELRSYLLRLFGAAVDG